jgi:hypothetical protein
MAAVRAITPMFKPVPGGYVYRPPTRWIFWRKRFYLVNEAQKEELLSIVAARGLYGARVRGYIFLIALVALIFSATMIVAYASGHRDPTGLDAAILLGLVPFYIYGALVISIWPITHRLEPILAGLPPHPPVSFLDWGRKVPDSAASQAPSEFADQPSEEEREEQLLEQIRIQELRTSRSLDS